MNDEPIRSSLIVDRRSLVLGFSNNTNSYFVLVSYLYTIGLSKMTICQFIYKEKNLIVVAFNPQKHLFKQLFYLPKHYRFCKLYKFYRRDLFLL